MTPPSTAWATSEYSSLLGAVNQTLTATITKYHLNYLPCSMVEPNDANRCSQPEGRQLGRAVPVRPLGLGRLPVRRADQRARLRPDRCHLRLRLRPAEGHPAAEHLGGYGDTDYSTGYNAGYGEWGLASDAHRDQGILGYQFMIANTQSGPYSWWESVPGAGPELAVGRQPPGRRRRRVAARLGFGRCQPGAARLAGGRAR